MSMLRYRVVVAMHRGPAVKATVHSPRTLGRMPTHEVVGLGALRDAPLGRLYVVEFDAGLDADPACILECSIRPEDPRPVRGLANLEECARVVA